MTEDDKGFADLIICMSVNDIRDVDGYFNRHTWWLPPLSNNALPSF